MRCGCTTGSRFLCGMSRRCSSLGVSRCPMKPSAGGVRSSVPRLQRLLGGVLRGPRDVWHLDEMQVKIGASVRRESGAPSPFSDPPHWLWRAVDAESYVLDEVVSVSRDKKQARRLFVQCLKAQGWRKPPRHPPRAGAIRIQPFTQGSQEQARKQPPAAPKAREDPSAVQIARQPSTLLGRLLRLPQPFLHPHRKPHRPPTTPRKTKHLRRTAQRVQCKARVTDREKPGDGPLANFVS